MWKNCKDLLICCDQRSKGNLEEIGLINGQRSSKCRRFPVRFLVALLACVGVFNTNTLKLHMSIALVAMVNETAIISHESNDTTFLMCPSSKGHHNGSSSSNDEDGPFVWSEATIGLILSAYFWGNVFGQIPGGMLADRYGGKWPFGVGILVSAFCTLIIPSASYLDVKLVVVLRVLCGLSQGLALPAMFSLLAKWVPKDERSRLTGLTFAGVSLGKVFVFPLSALMIQSSVLGGWPLVFYVFGSIPILWFLFWAIFIYDSPSVDPKVAEEERLHIQDNIHKSKHFKKYDVNWSSLLFSGPFWGMLIAYFSQAWGANTLLTILPSYLKFALGFNISSSGLINGLPHGAAFVVGLSASWTADWLRNSEYLSTTSIRKLFVAIAMFVPMGCLLGITFMPCSTLLLITLLTVAVASANLNAGGLFLNEMDLSIEISGTLKGLTSLCSNLSGILAPYIAGLLVQHNESVYEWNRVFYLSSSILFIGAATFLLLGSAQSQIWFVEQASEDLREALITEINKVERPGDRPYAEELHQ